MYNAIVLPLAKEDIKKAAHWYNDMQKGLGKRFTQEVRFKVLYIRENPKSSAVRYNKTHCVVMDGFPFMIHYTIDDEHKNIVVSVVFHTSLSPKHWNKR